MVFLVPSMEKARPMLDRKSATKLRIWNVRSDSGTELDGHLYVCATSRVKAVNLINRSGQRHVTVRGFDKIFQSDHWGKAMKGITPKSGVWIVRREGDKPERLI